MAVSATNTSGYLSALCDDWAKEFDLSRVDIQQDPMRQQAVIHIQRGKLAVRFAISADLFSMEELQRGLRAVKDMIYVQSKKLPQNRLDMRYNAIENMNDFLTLISRSRENNNEIDTVVLTPEQATMLQMDAMQSRPDLMGQPILTIYGYAVETKGQD